MGASLQGEGGLLGFAAPLPERGEEAGIQLRSFGEFQAARTCVLGQRDYLGEGRGSEELAKSQCS